MKHPNFRRFSLLTLLLGSLLLSSCNPSTSSSSEEEFQFDDIPLNDNPIEFEDKSSYYCNQAYDVDPDYGILIGSTSNSSVGFQSARFPYVTITDVAGNDVEFRTQIHAEDGEQYFLLTPSDEKGYEPGGFYEVTLNDEYLYYKDKDPEMDTFFFNVKQEEIDTRQVSDQIKYIDVADLIGSPNFDDPFAPSDPSSEEAAEYFRSHIYDFLYKKDVSSILVADDLFYVAEKEGNDWHIGFSSFPGQFVKCVYDKDYGAYRVYMKHADLNEVYNDGNEVSSDFKVYQKITPTSFTNVKNEFDEKEVIRNLKQDEKFIAQVDAIRQAVGTRKEVSTMDIVSHLSFDFTFRVDAPKVNFQVKVEVLFPLDDYTQIKIQLMYQYTVEFRCAAGINVKRFLGVPYWIDANGDVERITDQKYSANILFMNKWKEEEKKDTSNLQAIILTSLWKLEENPSYFTPGGKTSVKGNTRTVPILSFNIPFSIFNFHIGLDFVLVTDFNVMFGYTYTSHAEEKIVTFSTNDGVKCTANQTKNESSCHQLSFLGQISVKAGLSLTIDLEVCGLRGVFSVGVKADLGAYLDIKGGLMVTWGEASATDVIFSANFEMGIYAGVTGFLNVLMFHPKYEFVTKKWPMLAAGKNESITEMMTPKTIEIDSLDPINLDDTDITLAKVFSGPDLKFGMRHFQLNKQVELNKGLLEPSHKIYPISLESDSPKLIVNAETNTIQVNNEEPLPYFEATLTLKVHDEMAFASDTVREYQTKVIFRAKNTFTVTFSDIDGTHVFPVYDGTTVWLPFVRPDSELQAGEYRFDGYRYRDYVTLSLGFLRLNSKLTRLQYFADQGDHPYAEGESFVVHGDVVLRVIVGQP